MMTELLAPAGNIESLTAALRCGADAVYIGPKNYSARQNASNFDIDEIKEASKLCHLYNARLYLAVNTLILDNQLDDFISDIKKYAQCSPDAFIVQDPGAAYIIKNTLPDMKIHASTQMTIHTPFGAKFAESLGFSRVVISREASEEMIKEISSLGIETEVFVHGALCMSVSGQCYMSAMIGSRSANRGLCAQSCRLPFSAKGNMNDHCLSLKDLALAYHTDELRKAGVSSLKIEGRMKRPEYVACAVTAYRNALDGIAFDMDTLKAAFSRSGFTDGYFISKKENMFGMREKDDVLSTASVLPELKKLYIKERKVSGLSYNVKIKQNEPIKLMAVDDDGFSVSCSGKIAEAAINKPTDKETIENQLSKLGQTIYEFKKADIEIDNGLSVPASEINRLRRESVEELYRQRESAEAVEPDNSFSKNNFLVKNSVSRNKPKLRIRFENSSILKITDEILRNSDKLIIPMQLAYEHSDELLKYKNSVIIEPPRFISDEQKCLDRLRELKSKGFSHLMCTNVSYISSGTEYGFVLHGDFGLNITNSASMKIFSEKGLTDTIVSFEPKLSSSSKLSHHMPFGLIAYGKLPLMLTLNCPIKNQTGCKACRHIITDRTGRDFTVRCANGYTEIFNPDKLYLADKLPELEGFDFIELYFTDETPEQAGKIINDYTESVNSAPPGITRGLYYRGIK